MLSQRNQTKPPKVQAMLSYLYKVQKIQIFSDKRHVSGSLEDRMGQGRAGGRD